MKYLKLFEGGNDIFSKQPKYRVGDYIVVNDPKRQIYNETLKITEVTWFGGDTFSYTCSIPNDKGEYDNGLEIEIYIKKHIIRKLTKEEVQFIEDVKKYNL